MGTLVDFGGYESYQWRHWGCVTSKQIRNMKGVYESVDEIVSSTAVPPTSDNMLSAALHAQPGFDDLNVLTQIKIRKAFANNHDSHLHRLARDQ